MKTIFLMIIFFLLYLFFYNIFVKRNREGLEGDDLSVQVATMNAKCSDDNGKKKQAKKELDNVGTNVLALSNAVKVQFEKAIEKCEEAGHAAKAKMDAKMK
jgi:hypothetical protein